MTGLQACAVKTTTATTTTFYVRKHIYGKRIESKIIRKEKKKGSNPLSLSLYEEYEILFYFSFFFRLPHATIIEYDVGQSVFIIIIIIMILSLFGEVNVDIKKK